MAITPKQERNGIPELETARATPPGPYPDIPMAEAEAAGERWMDVAKPIWLGQNLGNEASSFDWSAGLAIVEPGSPTTSGSPTTNPPAGDAS